VAGAKGKRSANSHICSRGSALFYGIFQPIARNVLCRRLLLGLAAQKHLHGEPANPSGGVKSEVGALVGWSLAGICDCRTCSVAE
jgi:hypothetical protein